MYKLFHILSQKMSLFTFSGKQSTSTVITDMPSCAKHYTLVPQCKVTLQVEENCHAPFSTT